MKGEALECSTGVAAYPEHGKSGADLLRSVDAALYPRQGREWIPPRCGGLT
jgi:GGDEF domain-containing protein